MPPVMALLKESGAYLCAEKGLNMEFSVTSGLKNKCLDIDYLCLEVNE